MAKLAASGLHTFFVITFDSDLESIMEEAVNLGITGPGYLWNFADAVSGDAIQSLTKSSHRAALHGATRVYFKGAIDGVTTDAMGLERSRYDEMLALWVELSSVEANALGFRDSFKLDETAGSPTPLTIPFFDIGAYAYDAVAAAGLGACAIADPTVGVELYASIRNQTFVGVSGNVLFNEFGTRASSTANVIMENLLSNADGSVPLTIVHKAGWAGGGVEGSNGK